MSSANEDLIRGLYAAFATGDVPAILGAMSPDIVWNEAENFRYADNNPYRGPEAVAGGVFGRIGAEWDGFAAKMDTIHDAGDTIIATGRYTGVFKATGKAMNAQAVHVWTIKDGKAATFQQYVDTLQAARATGAA
ncbi:MAG: nuclear transport factor 2 family protein [Phenylobacterium sp.]